ncbi:MAG TPA: cold shock domain-containing protein [Roseiarcus sp.]|nr:cold shock domain-containing protein [Roseiarcus sp.]
MNRDCEFEASFGISGDAFAADRDRQRREEDASAEGSRSGGVAREGIVKWFRSDKGYGFIALIGGQGDAFLHLKALRAFGRETAAPGAKVSVVVDEGPRGMQVTQVVDIDEACVAPTAGSFSSTPRAYRRADRDVSSAIDLTGRVKWFDGIRGFGFVASDDFGRDVFVHCSVLGPAGVSRLDEGQTVRMRVIETPKGREAIEISL